MSGHLVDRVHKGMALLDSVDPSLLDRVDLDELRLSDACHCVLGQVGHQLKEDWGSELLGVEATPTFYFFTNEEFGLRSFHNALDGLGYGALVLTVDGAIEHGFALPDDAKWRDWEFLEGLWKAALGLRAEVRP